MQPQDLYKPYEWQKETAKNKKRSLSSTFLKPARVGPACEDLCWSPQNNLPHIPEVFTREMFHAGIPQSALLILVDQPVDYNIQPEDNSKTSDEVKKYNIVAIFNKYKTYNDSKVPAQPLEVDDFAF